MTKAQDHNTVSIINPIATFPLGVKRSPSEMADGDIDVASTNGPYNIHYMQYSAKTFDKLANLSYYNIENNKDALLHALHIAVEKKKKCKKYSPSQTSLF